MHPVAALAVLLLLGLGAEAVYRGSLGIAFLSDIRSIIGWLGFALCAYVVPALCLSWIKSRGLALAAGIGWLVFIVMMIAFREGHLDGLQGASTWRHYVLMAFREALIVLVVAAVSLVAIRRQRSAAPARRYADRGSAR